MLQSIVNGARPPVIVRSISPVAAPKQLTSVVIAVAAKFNGVVTEALSIVEQPKISVMVTVYNHAATLVISSVVAPLLHKYE